jgi:hypothetical protein
VYAYFYTKQIPNLLTEETVPNSGGIVEFEPNSFNAPAHKNINVPGIAAIEPLFLDSGTDLITSFIIHREGDYIVNFHITTNEAGGNAFALVSGGTVAAGDEGSISGTVYTTGMLSGFTLIDSSPQGTEIKESITNSIIHFTAGQQVSVVNVATTGHAQLDSNVTAGNGILAAIVFELLGPGTP